MKSVMTDYLRKSYTFAKSLTNIIIMKVDRAKIVAYVLAAVAVLLIVAGFFVPPMGEIDGSVLKGSGEIIGIIALFFAWHAVDKGIDAKFTHGDTSLELNNPDNKE